MPVKHASARKKVVTENTDFVPAIFIGKDGLKRGKPIFMPAIHNFWIPVDMEGNIMSIQDAAGNYVDPTTKEDFLAKKVMELYMGGEVVLPGPATDEESWQNAQDLEMFAQLKYKKQINDWLDEGKKPSEISAEIKKLNGLIGVARPKPEDDGPKG